MIGALKLLGDSSRIFFKGGRQYRLRGVVWYSRVSARKILVQPHPFLLVTPTNINHLGATVPDQQLWSYSQLDLRLDPLSRAGRCNMDVKTTPT